MSLDPCGLRYAWIPMKKTEIIIVVYKLGAVTLAIWCHSLKFAYSYFRLHLKTNFLVQNSFRQTMVSYLFGYAVNAKYVLSASEMSKGEGKEMEGKGERKIGSEVFAETKKNRKRPSCELKPGSQQTRLMIYHRATETSDITSQFVWNFLEIFWTCLDSQFADFRKIRIENSELRNAHTHVGFPFPTFNVDDIILCYNARNIARNCRQNSYILIWLGAGRRTAGGRDSVKLHRTLSHTS